MRGNANQVLPGTGRCPLERAEGALGCVDIQNADIEFLYFVIPANAGIHGLTASY